MACCALTAAGGAEAVPEDILPRNDAHTRPRVVDDGQAVDLLRKHSVGRLIELRLLRDRDGGLGHGLVDSLGVGLLVILLVLRGQPPRKEQVALGQHPDELAILVHDREMRECPPKKRGSGGIDRVGGLAAHGLTGHHQADAGDARGGHAQGSAAQRAGAAGLAEAMHAVRPPLARTAERAPTNEVWRVMATMSRVGRGWPDDDP
eukprot:CAMPEP_0182858392 /NCGR_PEP_ID=MMETSP0034_2-20130328/3647_1 /TAXON_ID=156128 /ORGANISM="Nephroselmis pyriformis, Strain CCMP717" /LENGTH=204 /DNA_ID=CAMNT_0024989809 /DNA_START=415 /DNA_END=1031 /DNA_ORIENTATION=+